MKIDVISDAVCPWCLIGKRKLEAALAQRPALAASVQWHPFELNPDLPPEGIERKTAIIAKFGSLENAQRVYQRVSAAGQEIGVEFNFDAISRTPNTLNAHRLIRWAGAAGKQDAVVDALFRYFFQQGKNIGDANVLLDAAQEAGLEREDIARKLASQLDRDEVLAEEAQARQWGVQGVPFFIFDGKYAVSGAQPTQVFLEVLDKLTEAAAA